MNIDELQDAVMIAVVKTAAHEGTALGVGDSIDSIPSALVGLRHATERNFVERYTVTSRAVHENWTRRVGTPGYAKPLWMAIDNAMTVFAHEVSTCVGFKGSWVPVERPARLECLVRSARSGDYYRFTYPKEPQFDKTLLVERVTGDSPDCLVFFEDHSHTKQKYLNKPGVERVLP